MSTHVRSSIYLYLYIGSNAEAATDLGLHFLSWRKGCNINWFDLQDVNCYNWPCQGGTPVFTFAYVCLASKRIEKERRDVPDPNYLFLETVSRNSEIIFVGLSVKYIIFFGDTYSRINMNFFDTIFILWIVFKRCASVDIRDFFHESQLSQTRSKLDITAKINVREIKWFYGIVSPKDIHITIILML